MCTVEIHIMKNKFRVSQIINKSQEQAHSKVKVVYIKNCLKNFCELIMEDIN